MLKRKVVSPLLTIILIIAVGFAIWHNIEPQPEPISLHLIVAVPVEAWVRAAADEFNSADHQIDGRPITINITIMDGLTAQQKWATDSFNHTLPNIWIAESSAWIAQTNAAAIDRTGQDIFLTNGQYRAQPLVISPQVWAVWQDAYDLLVEFTKTPHFSWDEVHDVAEIGYWNESGTSIDDNVVKLVIADPKRDPAGLTAMLNAASEYYDKPVVTTAELEDLKFLAWLQTILNQVIDSTPFGIENMLLFGRSNGDIGMILESDLLTNMEPLIMRHEQLLEIIYPDPIAWFDFPYAIYAGDETSVVEKEAALAFKHYLLSAEQQIRALDYGLRPTCPECPTTGGLIAQWEERGVHARVPSTTRMRIASRSGLESLLSWHDKTYGK